MTNAPRRWWLWVLASVAVVAIDQATKASVQMHFRPGEHYVVTSFFSLVFAFNTGMAFSFMHDVEGSRYFLSAVAVVAALIIVWLLRRGGNRWYCCGLAFILGGAIGNLWDRVALGHVVDFLLFHWRDWYYPAFNVADSAITVGAALLVLDAFRRRGHDPEHHGRPSR
jgi:signal peptidase II